MELKSTDYILVAGSSKGIGYAVVQELLDNYPNAHVIAISRNISNLQLLNTKYSDRLTLIGSDLSQPFSIAGILQNTKLKGIIYTAGVLNKFPLGTITYSNFEEVYKNNVWSLINTIQCCLPYIYNTHIVTLGSMGGINGSLKFPEMSVYSSSKGAVAIISECFAEDLKKLNTSINCLAIGAVNTEMMQKAFPDYHSNTEPQDIARFICNFTLSSKELFNGKTIPVSYTSP